MDYSAVRKVLLLAGAVLLLATASYAGASSDLQSGEILSVTSARGLDNVATHRFAIFTVQIADVIYTGSGKRVRHSGDDFSEGLNAGDAVHATIKGNEMILHKSDGGEVKTRIIKRARAQ